MHQKPLILISLLTLLGMAVATPVHAAEYVVTPESISRFNWSGLRPGDIVTLAPGVYQTSIRIHAKGTATAPITLRAAGKVTLFGGRSTPLPHCGQRGYRLQPAKSVALDLRSAQHVLIDGGMMRGLVIHGYNGNGIELSRSSSHVTVRNVEIYDNGTTLGNNPHHGRKGVNLAGTNITFERAIIHDNAADAFQSGGGLRNFTLRQSWLYNSRRASNGSAFNRCTHQDGIQIYGGGVQSGILIEDSVFGPGLLHGVLLGESDPTGKYFAQIDNVTIRNSTFTDADHINISAMQTRPRGWRLENVTATGATHHNIRLHGGPHTIVGLQSDGKLTLDRTAVQFGGGSTITLASLPDLPDTPGTSSGFSVFDYLPPFVRLALTGWLGFGADTPAPDVPPTLDLADIPGGACRIAAAYALQAMQRQPRYSQQQRLGPNSYDCSGLTHMAYKQAGVHIGWVVSDQMRNGKRTSCTMADLKGAATTCWAPGDLAVLTGFCSTPGCHISIYIKDGYFADCLNPHDGCKLWQPHGHWYTNYFAFGVRFDATCAKETTP